MAGIVANKEQYAALRSLAAVPISVDDLETLLDASLNKTAIRQNQELANKLSELIRACLDPKRFPWVIEAREATDEEIAAAKLATTVVTAISAVQAGRRGDESKALEGKVKEILIAADYVEVKRRPGGIKQIAHFPDPGSFMRQCPFGGHNADFVIRLKDGRVLALECKASNSEVNGFKRLNKEVVVDARDWHQEFGKSSVVASAALRGVFKPANVASAQEQDVFIFWWHSMESLADFLTTATPNSRR
ncbi:XamI family restriction endonuclease [Variovorax sp. 54]|uniref:XamI family restriction endonuclease n=1 Tax=Variovorax sp. 54 TaxID=2035212 RepID=UPI0015D4A95A|nr:XamI family restriction endonuclease [Variovorax sp. 54]